MARRGISPAKEIVHKHDTSRDLRYDESGGSSTSEIVHKYAEEYEIDEQDVKLRCLDIQIATMADSLARFNFSPARRFHTLQRTWWDYSLA